MSLLTRLSAWTYRPLPAVVASGSMLIVGCGPTAVVNSRAMGIAFFFGMPGVTIVGVFLTPVFYFVLERVGVSFLVWQGPKRWLSQWAAIPLTTSDGT